MKRWGYFFALVPILGTLTFVLAPYFGCDLPRNISTFGERIDWLYWMIMAITGITFVGTQIALVYILFNTNSGKPELKKATYSHGNRFAEITWTIIPSAILLFIALIQLPDYVKMRFPSSAPRVPVTARVIARQFEWRIIYPGPDSTFNTPDDVWTVNELHVARNKDILVDLTSMDVLHSFFLPNVRIKQDAVPGLMIPVWFDAKLSTREYQLEQVALKPTDLDDVAEFMTALRDKKNPLTKLIADNISPEARTIIGGFSAKVNLSQANLATVLAGLTKVMQEINFNDPKLLEGTVLGKETQFNAKFATPAQRLLINRQILADAIPTGLKPVHRNFELVCAELCGWGHYKMRGKMVVHDTQEELNQFLEGLRAEQETTR